MSIRTLAARGLSFAHLAGLTSRAARAENEDDERKQREGESDDDYAKRMEELDEEEEKARKAEKERKEEEARKAEEEKKEEEARAKGEEDDDSDPDAEDDDDEMRGSSQAARARRREQARCAAIFASKGAARNPVLAANLAFKTRMTRAEAIATLREPRTRRTLTALLAIPASAPLPRSSRLNRPLLRAGTRTSRP